MKAYKYIIIGGGMTASAAVKKIRENDLEGTIAMFTEESYGPYDRPPLTKGLWNGKEIEDIVRPVEKYHIDLYLETSIEEISRQEKWVKDQSGEIYSYQRLLIATGGNPIKISDTPEDVIVYRTRADYQALRARIEGKTNICIVGGGFVGSELAAALTKLGKQVTMIFPEIGISGLTFPDELAKFLNDYYRERGVEVLNGHLVQSINKQGERFQVAYKNSEDSSVHETAFDEVIVGIGIKPNVEIAKEAGLQVENGVIVNEFLQTNDPNIFAAGDVANFYNLGLEKRVRVEHENNALKMGATAGQNMSGLMEKYDHFPFFYSDLFDLGYEAIGDINKKLETYSHWIEPYKKGTIFYLEEGKIRGLVFWNLWGKIDEGRKLISEGKTYQQSELADLFSD